MIHVNASNNTKYNKKNALIQWLYNACASTLFYPPTHSLKITHNQIMLVLKKKNPSLYQTSKRINPDIVHYFIYIVWKTPSKTEIPGVDYKHA